MKTKSLVILIVLMLSIFISASFVSAKDKNQSHQALTTMSIEIQNNSGEVAYYHILWTDPKKNRIFKEAGAVELGGGILKIGGKHYFSFKYDRQCYLSWQQKIYPMEKRNVYEKNFRVNIGQKATITLTDRKKTIVIITTGV